MASGAEVMGRACGPARSLFAFLPAGWVRNPVGAAAREAPRRLLPHCRGLWGWTGGAGGRYGDVRPLVGSGSQGCVALAAGVNRVPLGMRGVTVRVSGGAQRGHGRHGHVGLLSVVHPITRGEAISEEVGRAAERHSPAAEEARRRSGLEMNGVARPQRSAVWRAAEVFILEGLEGGRDASSQFHLGVMLWKGLGVKRDLAEAAKAYRMAADQGHALAHHNLGYCLLFGRGVDGQDASGAARNFGEAAAQGVMQAQYAYGACCMLGLGVARDVGMSAEWFARASDQGFAPHMQPEESRSKATIAPRVERRARLGLPGPGARRRDGTRAGGAEEPPFVPLHRRSRRGPETYHGALKDKMERKKERRRQKVADILSGTYRYQKGS